VRRLGPRAGGVQGPFLKGPWHPRHRPGDQLQGLSRLLQVPGCGAECQRQDLSLPSLQV